MTSLKLLTDLLGERSDSPRLRSILENAASAANIALAEAEIKAYPNSVYFNYYAVGLSLIFILPANQNVKPGGDYREYVIDSIDIYNPHQSEGRETRDTDTGKKTFAIFPMLPIDISGDSNTTAELTTKSTGEDIVRMLGEPERKGGGSGPLSGSISIWCEWTKKGIMIEFGGEHARGPQAWERGKDAIWKVLTIFP